MSTINDTDQFLVQRGITSHKQSAVDLMSTIQDTDLMLVQRGTDSFKVTCKDVKDQLGGGGEAIPPVLNSVTLTQNAPVDANRFTSKSFTTTTAASGGVATTLELTGNVTGVLGLKAGSAPIETNNYPGTSSTSVVLDLESAANLGDTFVVGDVVQSSASYTPETDLIDSVSDSPVVNWNPTLKREGGSSNPQGSWSPQFVFDGDPDTGLFQRNQTTTSAIPYVVFETASLSDFFYANTAVAKASWNPTNTAATYGNQISITYLDGVSDLTLTVTGTDNSAEYANSYKYVLPRPELPIKSLYVIPTIGGSQTWPETIFYILGFDGQLLVNDLNPVNKILTLSGEKDIELFQVGDVVQGDASAISIENGTNENPLNFGLKGEDGNYAFPTEPWDEYIKTLSNWTTAPTMTTPMGLVQASSTVVKYPFNLSNVKGRTLKVTGYYKMSQASPYSHDVNFICTLDNPNHTVVTNTAVKGWTAANSSVYDTLNAEFVLTDNDYTDLEVTFTVSRTQKIEQKDYVCICHWEIVGTGAPDVSVVSTDVAAKTITVDGGTWDNTNQSEVWSKGTLNTVTGRPLPITNAFDGNLVDSYFSGNGNAQEATFTFDNPIPFTELKLHYQMNRGGGANSNICELYINGSLVQDTNSEGSAVSGTNGRPVATKDFTSQVTSPITSIGYKYEMNGSQVRIHGIETESGILVDAVNDSQVWSDDLSATSVGYEPVKAFDGSLSTYAIADAAGAALVWTPDGGMPYTSLVRVYTDADYGGVVNYVSLNGGDQIAVGDTNRWVTLDSGSGTITSISAQYASTYNGSIFAIEVDGKILIDPGVRDLGDNIVSTVSPKQGSGTISDITDSVVTIEPFTDNCFKEGQYLTVNKTVTVSPVTDDIDTYTKATKTLTFDGQTDLLQFEPNDAVYMVDADGNQGPFTFESDSIVGVTTGTATTYSENVSYTGEVWEGTPEGIFSDARSFGVRAGGTITVTFDPPIENFKFDAQSGDSSKPGVSYRFSPTGTYQSVAVNGSIISGPAEAVDYLELKETDTSNGVFLAACYSGDTKLLDSDYSPSTVLTLSGDTDLNKFAEGDVVQSAPDTDFKEVKILSISEDGDDNHPSITVNGGDWSYVQGRICESDPIESVSNLTATVIELLLSGTKDLGCFQTGDLVQNTSFDLEYLVIAGGGTAVAPEGTAYISGGGAGGYISGVAGEKTGGGLNSPGPLSLDLSAGPVSFDVTAGAINEDSSISGSTWDYLAKAGGTWSANNGVGGSGAGGAQNHTADATQSPGAEGTAGQGFKGGDGSNWQAANCNSNSNFNCNPVCSEFNGGRGGGGAGGPGGGNRGGLGVTSSITGTAVTYAAGGRGNSKCAAQNVDPAGYQNYGSGGSNTYAAQPGAVILRYPKYLQIVPEAGGTASLDTIDFGDYRITTITDGSCTVTMSLSGVADDNKPVQIIDIKPEVPSITVDGGKWAGTDGTSTGDLVGGFWVSGTFASGYTGDKAFDGIANNGTDTCACPDVIALPEICNWEGSIPIPPGAVVTASVWAQAGTTSGTLKVNNVDVTPPATGASDANLGMIDITAAAGSEITALEINRILNSSGGIGFAAIYINGEAVIGDKYTSGLPSAGDTTVKYGAPPVGTGDSKVSTTKTGSGTVSVVVPSTNTMVLSESDDGWVPDYRVATATKPAVATTAYLQFSADGTVTGYQATPVDPRAMDNTVAPTLTFPATFDDTGNAPDVEFPDINAYIQTSAQLKNSEGSSVVVKSNNVIPATSDGFSVGSGQVANNADEIRAMAKQIATHDQRVADHTASERQQKADDFEAALKRYSK